MEQDEYMLSLKNAAGKAQEDAHGDEAVERELKQSIYDAKMDIFGIPTYFEDRKLLEDKISIRIPKDFIALEDDVVHALYPLGNRPQLVMGNEPLYFMLGFNHTNHRVPEEQIKEFPLLAKAMLEKCGPKTTAAKSKAILCGGRQVSTMNLVSHPLEGGAMYNMMFYSNVDARLLIGFFNFRFQDRKRLEPLCWEMIESYRILTDLEGEPS